jgi:hypothetical protein
MKRKESLNIDGHRFLQYQQHKYSYRNSLKTKSTMTYDVGNTDPCLERGKQSGGLALTRRVPLVKQKCIHCILLLWVSPYSFCPVTRVHNLSSVFYSIQLYGLKFVSDFRYVGGFLRFPPTIKLTVTI